MEAETSGSDAIWYVTLPHELTPVDSGAAWVWDSSLYCLDVYASAVGTKAVI